MAIRHVVEAAVDLEAVVEDVDAVADAVMI